MKGKMQELKRADPLYEQIYRYLEEGILKGQVTIGERLIDTKVAKDFGVSRSPVREAFRRLEKDGLLINNEGIITVFTPSLKDVIELYQVRIGLEASAAYWATKYITKHELVELHQILEQTQLAIEQKNMEDVILLNTRFHDSIVTYSHNSRLKTMMHNIQTLIRLCRNTIIKQYNRSDSFLLEHYEIYNAMKKKDSELATEKMKQHIHRDMKYFEKFYQNEKTKHTTNFKGDLRNEYRN
ncbi:transcriptional regulator [Mycobacteroides abscessus subsp. abscessus]|nr:transcriptional regulator [Mycobacteroides abscessus subsp. abscessus]